MITSKSGEDEIKKEVEALCSHLPAAIQNEVSSHHYYLQRIRKLFFSEFILSVLIRKNTCPTHKFNRSDVFFAVLLSNNWSDFRTFVETDANTTTLLRPMLRPLRHFQPSRD